MATKRATTGKTAASRRTSGKGRGKTTRAKRTGRSRKSAKGNSRFSFYALLVTLSLATIAFFYFFFIRPYEYRWRPCFGEKAYGVCVPLGYQVHGIDISRHQGTVDWKLLKTATVGRFPIRFIFMKATEGGDFKDVEFDNNFANARNSGFLRGAYHFYNPETSGAQQAQFFINTVSLEIGDLPPVLDVEKKPKNVDAFRRDLSIWLQMVEQHYKVKPIIYSSKSFYKKYLDVPAFKNYPYWIAHYYVKNVDSNIHWNFWQYTDVGTLPGIKQNVDMDIFNGTWYQMLKMTLQQ